MTRNEVMAQLKAQVSYTEAIDRYNYLKEKFLLEYNALAQQEEEKNADQILKDTFAEINNNPIENQESLMQEILVDVGKYMRNTLNQANSNQNAEVKALQKKYADACKENKKKVTQSLKTAVDKIFDPEIVAQDIKNIIFARTGLNNNGFDYIDIINQAKGYFYKTLLRNKANASQSAYLRAGKGFIREAAIYNTMQQFLQKIDPMLSNAIKGGSMKNISGVDTEYDLFIDFDSIDNFSLAVDLNYEVGYGLQAKSWQAPWESYTPFAIKYGFHIGSRSDLLGAFISSLKNKTAYGNWGFFKSVKFLENKLVEVIGPRQLAYITGKSFVWTADLIKEFRQHNFYASFGLDKNNIISNPLVSWQHPRYSLLKDE